MGKSINIIRKSINIPKSCREEFMSLGEVPNCPLFEKGIYHSGISSVTSGYEICLPKTQNLMLILTHSGSGRFESHEGSFDLSSQDFLLSKPSNGLRFFQTQGIWKMLWFYIFPVEPWLEVFQGPPEILPCHQIEAYENAMRGHLIHGGQRGNPNLNAQNLFMRQQYAEIILNLLQGSLLHKHSSRPANPLEELHDEIRRNPGGNWSVPGLAEFCGVSVPTLHRMTQSHYRHSPWQMVLEARMNEAKRLLQHTPYPLKVIAERLGYKDPYTFSTAFKNTVGMSPKNWQKNSKLST